MKRRPSLRRTLLLRLLSTILLAWLMVVGLVFLEARQEVREVFDADLARSARVLSALLRHEVQEEQRIRRQVEAVSRELGSDGLGRYPLLASLLAAYKASNGEEELDLGRAAMGSLHRYESKLALLARYRGGGVMLRTPGAPAFPMDQTGYFDFAGPSGRWHGFGLTDTDTGFLVQVGEKQQIRTELVDYIVGNSLLPFLLALPLLGLIIWLGVGRALGPLARLAAEVKRRVPESLEAFPEGRIPDEVLPLVRALNGLLERVGSALEHERRFTADAAHELRTPLAALKTQAQVARGQVTDPAMGKALDQVLVGVDRATHLVAQLLTLARADAGSSEGQARQAVDLSGVAREVLSGLGQQAVQRDADLALEAPEPVTVAGDVTALEVLLRNLVDNALRYGPVGGRVEVRVVRDNGQPLLEVADNGPGIAPRERERIFERFYRGNGVKTTGSGLGLSIVRCIADLHGARLTLVEGLDGRGLGVRVWFPGAPAAGNVPSVY